MSRLSLIPKILLHISKSFQTNHYYSMIYFDRHIKSALYKSKNFLLVPLRFLLSH